MFLRKRNAYYLKLAALSSAAFFAYFIFAGDNMSGSLAIASAHQPSPGHTRAPGETSCILCHTGSKENGGAGNITITGLPANYLPGQEIPVTVTVSQSDAVIYGFQLTAIDTTGTRIGTYLLPSQTPPELQVTNGVIGGDERQYVSHTIDGVKPTAFGSKSWTFTWKAPAIRGGRVGFYAAGNAANSDGGPGGDQIYTTAGATLSGSAISNFDTDGVSDMAVFRPSNGVWYTLNSSDGGVQEVPFGIAGDVIAPGDYDGDGITDRAVFRPSDGTWYVSLSTGGYTIVRFGLQGDVPVPGDYDGDLKTDIAIWRPSTGVWYIRRSSDGTYDIRQFGLSMDLAVPGDYDGDAKTDIAIWRPESGVWYIWRSSDGGYSIFPFGLSEDQPIQADFDGDGRHDAAVFRPSTSTWYVLGSRDGFFGAQFGVSTDRPVPADYDGDGKADIAVFREGVWFIYRSSDGGYTVGSFGSPDDIPIPAGYLPEN
ncbi:MAG TPA: choice-of-anchor V domain-containing protein [Pyrinomonadaceae bacterium]|nr:choice-of-anchor V domain-containing protein [Pyrinomonadaceae bacterium]